MLDRIEFLEINNTYITGSKLIDSIIVSLNVIDYIKGYKLLKANEIIITNHHSYIVDINFKRYFNS